MNPRMPADQPQRDRIKDDLANSIFVEAGAGTGKTSSLVDRIVALLRGRPGTPPVPIRNIAAITFTEKAGGELRSRIHSELTKVVNSKDPELTERLTPELRAVDTAEIGTIHSFCLSILREHCLAAGLPIGFTVADEAESAEGKRTRWRAVHDACGRDLSPAARGTLAAAGIRLIDLRTLVETLDTRRSQLAAVQVDWGFRVDGRGLLATVAGDIAAWTAGRLADCTNPDDKLAIHLRDNARRLARRLSDVAAMPEESRATAALGMLRHWTAARGAQDPSVWEKVFKPGNVGASKAWEPTGPKPVRDALKDFQPRVVTALRTPVENAIREALQIADGELQHQAAARRRSGLLEYDDLLVEVRDLILRDADVRRSLHERYRVVLVDEFQDTDPVQWEIVRLITSDPTDPNGEPLPGRLVVVGDPKQAIYSFRGADITTYLEARTRFDGSVEGTTARFGSTTPTNSAEGPTEVGERVELSVNFRTVRPVIDWINAVFTDAMSTDPDDPRSPFQAPYVSLIPHHAPPTDSSTGPAVVLLTSPAAPADSAAESGPQSAAVSAQPTPQPPDTRLPAGISDAERESTLVADTIRRAVADGWRITEPAADRSRAYTGNASFRDVAILLPTRTSLDTLLTGLDDAGVPYRSGDASLVYQRPMVAGMIAAVGAIADSGSALDIWQALKSPLFGCSDDDLLAHRNSGGRWRLGSRADATPTDRVAAALRLLATIRDARPSPAPSDVLRALAEQCRAFETLTISPRGDFDADCVRMVIDHAAEWESGGGAGLEAYLAWVDAVQGDSSRVRLPEPDDRGDDAVQIMTIHAAKGLEFPIVVLSGMTSQRMSTVPDVGIDSDRHLQFRVKGLAAPVGLGPSESTGYTAWKADDHQPRQDAELLRLLYVACTRARDHLVVSLVGDPAGKRDTRARALRDAALAHSPDATVVSEPTMPAVGVPDGRLDALPGQAPPPLPDDWAARVAAVRLRSALPSVTSPSSSNATPSQRDDIPATQGSGHPAELSAIPEQSGRSSRATRDGRPLGRAVHGTLDVLLDPFGSSSGRADEPISVEAVDESAARLAAEEGIPARSAEVAALARHALASPLVDRALNSARRWTELYVAAPVAPDAFDPGDGIILGPANAITMVEGYADLVFLTPETDGEPGHLVLVDYKTDADLTRAMDHYRAQLAGYRSLLEQSTGLTVREVWLLHLTDRGAVEIPLHES